MSSGNPNEPSSSVDHIPALLTKHHLGIKHDPKCGRSVYALKDINRGSLIFSQKPYISVFELQEGNVCHCCRQTVEKTLRCSRCRVARYCTVKCQGADWPTHKMECAILNALPEEKRHQKSLFSVRLLLKVQSERSSTSSDSSLGDNYLNVLNMIKINDQVWESDAGIEFVEHLRLAGKDKLQFSFDEIKDILMRTIKNSFSVLNRYNIAKAQAIYPTASLFNHSCKPNAWAYFDEDMSIKIVALENIPSGGEIFISYNNGTEHRSVRRLNLRKNLNFWCECSQCAKEADTREIDTQESLTCESCPKIENQHMEIWKLSTEISHKEALKAIATSIADIGLAPPDSHEAWHLRSHLWDAILLAQRLKKPDQIIIFGTRLLSLLEDGEVPQASQNVSLLKYQVAIAHLHRLEWKKAHETLCCLIPWLELSRSQLLEEASILNELARNPNLFPKYCAALQLIPYGTDYVNDLVARLFQTLPSASYK